MAVERVVRAFPSYKLVSTAAEYYRKFNSIWEPRYLASPGGLQIQRVLTDVSSLISGGLTGIVAK